jgi:uncharacterized membrane protein YgcG
MKNVPKFRTSLGCALLGASLVACGTNTSHTGSNPTTSTSSPVPLSTVALSAKTQAETGAATWQFYKAKPTVANAEDAFEMVARSAHGKVLHAMKVEMIRGPLADSARGAQVSTSKPHMLIDENGHILESTLSVSALQLHQKLAGDAQQANMQEYACVGDIAWTVGGVIVSIPACAAIVPGAATGPLGAGVIATCVGTVIAGPVAGAISVYEDCSSIGDGIWNFFFQDDDGEIENEWGTPPPGEAPNGGGIADNGGGGGDGGDGGDGDGGDGGDGGDCFTSGGAGASSLRGGIRSFDDGTPEQCQ